MTNLNLQAKVAASISWVLLLGLGGCAAVPPKAAQNPTQREQGDFNGQWVKEPKVRTVRTGRNAATLYIRNPNSKTVQYTIKKLTVGKQAPVGFGTIVRVLNGGQEVGIPLQFARPLTSIVTELKDHGGSSAHLSSYWSGDLPPYQNGMFAQPRSWEEIKRTAGYPIREPSWLPDGVKLTHSEVCWLEADPTAPTKGGLAVRLTYEGRNKHIDVFQIPEWVRNGRVAGVWSLVTNQRFKVDKNLDWVQISVDDTLMVICSGTDDLEEQNIERSLR